MPQCAVWGCKKFPGQTNEEGKKLSFHSFPLKNSSCLKAWVHACGRQGFTPSKGDKMCSLHFDPGDFERDLQLELMGQDPKSKRRRATKLKPGSTPRLSKNHPVEPITEITEIREHSIKRAQLDCSALEEESGTLKENAVVQSGRPKQLIEEADTDVVLKKEDEVDTASDTDVNQEPNLRIEAVKTEAEDDLDENSRLSSDPSSLEEEKVEIKTEPLEEDEDAPALVTPTGLVISQQYVHNLEQQVQILQAKCKSQESEICKLKNLNHSLLETTVRLNKERRPPRKKLAPLKGQFSQTVPVMTFNNANVKSTPLPLFVTDTQGNVYSQQNGRNSPNASPIILKQIFDGK